MLGTGAVFSDEVLISTLRPLKEEEANWAFTALVPMGAPGVKALSRRSYEASAPSAFDYPLSTRFDENDAVLYFDEVKVPWDRVLVHRDSDVMLAQWHQTPAHMYQNYQSAIRLMVKMRFLVGIAHKTAEMTGAIKFPAVGETLGRLAANVGMVDSFVYGMEGQRRALRRLFRPRPQYPLCVAVCAVRSSTPRSCTPSASWPAAASSSCCPRLRPISPTRNWPP